MAKLLRPSAAFAYRDLAVVVACSSAGAAA